MTVLMSLELQFTANFTPMMPPSELPMPSRMPYAQSISPCMKNRMMANGRIIRLRNILMAFAVTSLPPFLIRVAPNMR